MKTILLSFLTVLLVCSCNHAKTSDIACVCYIFDPECSFANTYIEIHEDGFIEATEGLCTDTIDHIIYDEGGKLYPNKNIFISSEEFPDSEYDESCKTWTYHTYKSPTVKNGFLSKKQMDNLNCRINQFFKAKKKSKNYNRINKDDIDWNSYGIVLLMKGKVFKYWENSSSQEEKDFLNFIKNISPLTIKPKIPKKDRILKDVRVIKISV
jgi:hypothetical protein